MPCSMALSPWSAWFRHPGLLFPSPGRRVVLGADRLQIIDGMGELVTQIPYRNIGRMETRGQLVHMLGINVSNKDRETFWGSGDRGKSRGYDVIIYDVYTEPVERIRELIINADGLWRDSQAAFPPVSYLASPDAPIAPAENSAGPHVKPTPYDQCDAQGNVELGRLLLEVETAAGTVHYTLLLYGFMLAGLMLLAAVVYLLLPHWGFGVRLTGIPCLAMGLGLGLACFNTLQRRLALHERGVCVRGLFGARELLDRDLAGVEIAPWIISRTLNFVPISRDSVLQLKFVPRDAHGLEADRVLRVFHERDRVTELIRTRWGKGEPDVHEPMPRATMPVESRNRAQASDSRAVGRGPERQWRRTELLLRHGLRRGSRTALVFWSSSPRSGLPAGLRSRCTAGWPMLKNKLLERGKRLLCEIRTLEPKRLGARCN